MKRSVFDASVVIKLYFEENDSESAVAEFEGAEEALAPDLIWAECANVVWKKHRRGELTSEQAVAAVGKILILPLQIHPSAALVSQATGLATELDRTVYDCLYLALAIREKCELLTADRKFFNALRSRPAGKHIRFVAHET